MVRASSAGRGPQQSIGYMLRQVTLAWQNDVTRALEPHGITYVQFLLLGSLMWLGESASAPPTQRELAEHAGADLAMTSQVLQTLERRGYVRRTVDAVDRRSRRIALTAPGKRVAQRGLAAVKSVDAAFFAALGSPRTFMESLQVLAATGTPPDDPSRLR